MSFSFTSMAMQSIPGLISRGYYAVKNLISNPSDAHQVMVDFTKDTAMETAKNAVKCVLGAAVPGCAVLANAAVDFAADGINSALYQDKANLPIAFAKGGLRVVNATLAGPVGAIPLSMATDYAVDKAADIYKLGFTTAYHNYKNNSSWTILPYLPPEVELQEHMLSIMMDNGLDMSFASLNLK